MAVVGTEKVGSFGTASCAPTLALNITVSMVLPAPWPPARGDPPVVVPAQFVHPGELLAVSSATGLRGEVVVTATGEIDLCTSPRLKASLTGALNHPSCRTLIIDLRAVRFLGACGIAVLETAWLRAAVQDVRLVVVADSRAVLRVLSLTLVTDAVAVFPTISAARIGHPVLTGDHRRAVGRC